jgi:hypothetical protein
VRHNVKSLDRRSTYDVERDHHLSLSKAHRTDVSA